MILLKISAQYVLCVYLTLQLSYREFPSCGGLQTSRYGGRREYETVGSTPTCCFLVGRLFKTPTVGWIFLSAISWEWLIVFCAGSPAQKPFSLSTTKNMKSEGCRKVCRIAVPCGSENRERCSGHLLIFCVKIHRRVTIL